MKAREYRPGPRKRAAVPVFCAVLAAAGCAANDDPHPVSRSNDVQSCTTWIAALDETVDREGVHDGKSYPVRGFPYLRINQFLASFRSKAQEDQAAFAAWEGHLRALDRRARAYELQNLPPQALATLGVNDRTEAERRTDSCAAILVARDVTNSARRASLIEDADVPDGYTTWKRVVGLYPLVRIPFFEMAKEWEGEETKMFADAAAAKSQHGDIVRYHPSGDGASAQVVAALLANAKRDVLGIPQLSDRDAEFLFAAFAPVYEVETTGDYDRIGPLRWGTREAPEVDLSRPTVYRRLAFTRYGDQTLVQVVYLIWFSERPDSSWLDPLSGKLDGLFLRVTLDATGRPLVYDFIHPCGCYHMFFPTPLVEPIASPDPGIEWAFIPRSLPVVALPQRIVVRLTSRRHYLTDIRVEAGGTGTGVTYVLADETQLRTLSTPAGTRSAFAASGTVPGTERGERFMVWPLGIEDPGSMHEWGGHLTATVGRRHFDDADLIERRFALQPVATGLNNSQPRRDDQAR